MKSQFRKVYKAMVKLRLDWTANPANQMVTSYQIWQGYNGSAMTKIAETDTNSYEINDPPTGSYSFALKAVNLAGTSGMSSAALGPSLPSTPSTPVVTVVVV